MRRAFLSGAIVALAGCDGANGPGRPANAVDVTFAFCAEGPPDWFAYQDSGRAWVSVPVTESSASVTFPATPTVGVAKARELPFGAYEVEVYYVTAAEVEELGCRNDGPAGSRTLFAPFLRPDTLDIVSAWLGGGFGATFEDTTASTLRIEGAPDSVSDLLAVLTPGGEANPRLTILRHGIDAASGDTVSLLDFTSAEAFPIAHSHIDVMGNEGGYNLTGHTTFMSARRTIWKNTSYVDVTDTVAAIGIAEAQLAPDDYHRIDIFAPSIGMMAFYMHALHDTTVSFGTQLAAVNVDTVATAPSLRLRFRVAANEYTSFARANFGGGGSVASVLVTSGFLGASPETWDITVPELPHSIAARMPQAGTSWFIMVEAYHGRLGLEMGTARPNPGDYVLVAHGYP